MMHTNFENNGMYILIQVSKQRILILKVEFVSKIYIHLKKSKLTQDQIWNICNQNYQYWSH